METRQNAGRLRPQRTSELLEARARKPFTPNRSLLLHLAARVRAMEALQRDPAALRRVVAE